MSTKATVFIQAAVVVIAGIAAGVAHLTAKPISRALTPAEPTTPTQPAVPQTSNAAQSALQPPGSIVTPLTPTPPPATTNSHDKLPPGTFCTIEQAKQLLDDQAAEFIDARNPDEFAAGAIPTAFNIPPDAFAGGNFPPYLSTIASDRKIIVYCGGGDCDASLLVALKIKGSGFKDVIVFKEGYSGWTAAKFPTTGGAQ